MNASKSKSQISTNDEESIKITLNFCYNHNFLDPQKNLKNLQSKLKNILTVKT